MVFTPWFLRPVVPRCRMLGECAFIKTLLVQSLHWVNMCAFVTTIDHVVMKTKKQVNRNNFKKNKI